MLDADWTAILSELLNDDSDTMNAWEVEFIDSLREQRHRKGSEWCPSPKQLAALGKAWDKVFG